MARPKKRRRKTTSFDAVEPNEQGRITREQLEGDLPELSARGGVEPTERSPGEYSDRTINAKEEEER